GRAARLRVDGKQARADLAAILTLVADFADRIPYARHHVAAQLPHLGRVPDALDRTIPEAQLLREEPRDAAPPDCPVRLGVEMHERPIAERVRPLNRGAARRHAGARLR